MTCWRWSTKMARMGVDPFQPIFASGLAALRSGRHGAERDPRESGRWGPSIVLLPSGRVADRLGGLAQAATECLDGRHWLSGGPGRAHLTVRALEPFAESIQTDRLLRYRVALARAADDLGPLTFEFTGVGISSGSVMVRAIPTTDAADRLRVRLGLELGADGWLEDAHFENGRDPIWYCSILHYAGPIGDADRLIDWVSSQDRSSFGTHTFKTAAICCWDQDGAGMAPRVVESVEFSRTG